MRASLSVVKRSVVVAVYTSSRDLLELKDVRLDNFKVDEVRSIWLQNAERCVLGVRTV